MDQIHPTDQSDSQAPIDPASLQRDEFPSAGTYRSTDSCQAATRLAEESGLIVSDYPGEGKKAQKG